MSSQIQELIAAERKASAIVAESRSGMIGQLHHNLSMHKLSVPSAGLVRFLCYVEQGAPTSGDELAQGESFSTFLAVYINSDGVIGCR